MSGADFDTLPATRHALTAVTPDQARRHVAVVLIGIGLRETPAGQHWQMAHDVVQALGLIPTIPAIPPYRHGESGAVGEKRRAALRALRERQAVDQ